MGSSLGLVVEALVAVLLMVTIGYCLLVNRKLERLRSDQSELRQIIRELNGATAQAEAAIAALRDGAQTAETALAAGIERATELAESLRAGIEGGEKIATKLAFLARAPRPAPADPPAAPPRREVRASSIGLGLLNARQRAQAGDAGERGAA